MPRWMEEKQRVRTTIMREISGRRVGFTTDMWTSAANRGYMAITMHYINNEWKMKSVMIAFVRVLSPHTAVRLAEHLVKSVEEMDAQLLSSIWTITCENATNNDSMVAELAESLTVKIADKNQDTDAQEDATSSFRETMTARHHVIQLRCMAHVLQLAVKEGLKQSPVVESSIAVLRDIMKKIRESTLYPDSPKLSEALTGICERLSLKPLQSVLDVETRWNSTWQVIDRVLKLRPAVEDLLRRILQRHDGFADLSIAPGDRLAGPISESTWEAAELFCWFLSPFKEATDLMSGSTYPTPGMIVPMFSVIEQHIEQSFGEESDPSFAAFVGAVKSKLQQYSGTASIPEVRIAAGVDPRIKPHLITFGLDKEFVKELLVEEYNLHYRTRHEAQQRRNQQQPQRPPSQVARRHARNGRNALPLIQSMIRSQVSADNFGVDSEPFWKEVDRWFKSDGLDIDAKSSEVCEWFCINGKSYRRIEIIACDYLALPATSVPSEIAFSKAGCIVRDHRARLGDDSVRAVCELQSFLSFNRS